MTPADCPFTELCERDLIGPDLSDEEQQGLSQHLSEGCPLCEGRIEEQLTGSGEGGDAEDLRQLHGQLERAVEFAGEAMAGSQLAVLAKVRDRIGAEDLQARRRIRRRGQRILFYVVNLVAVVLIASAYVGTLMAARVQRVGAVRLEVRNELNSLAVALTNYVKDHPGQAPNTAAELVTALSSERPNGGPYYPFDVERVQNGLYFDSFGSPYVYGRQGSRATLTSQGPNGQDDRGRDDDIARQVIFAHE